MSSAMTGAFSAGKNNASDFFENGVLRGFAESAGAFERPWCVLEIKVENGFDFAAGAGAGADAFISGLCHLIAGESSRPVWLYRHTIDRFYLCAPAREGGDARDDVQRLAEMAQSFAVSAVTGPDAEEKSHIGLVAGGTLITGKADIKHGFFRAHLALAEAVSKSLRFKPMFEDGVNREEIIRGQISAGYINRALQERRLRFAYQPVIDYKNNSVAYYECLLRLVEHDFSLVPAGAFIPVAEKMGFIDKIDQYVFDLVLEELRNYPDINFAVNVSTTTIQRGAYTPLLDALKEDKEAASRLMVEVTESGAREGLANIITFMEKFKECGCKIALDDFGVGHTSFSELISLPLDVVKVDGKFVRGLKSSPQNWLLVDTVIKYGKQSNMKTVAEFVENEALANELIKMDVDYLQGNYFAPAANTRLWLEPGWKGH